jgi:hypothetical protein
MDRAMLSNFDVDFDEVQPPLPPGSVLKICVQNQFYSVMTAAPGRFGEKTMEYRADTDPQKRPYWHPRLEGRVYDYVKIYGGVARPDDNASWTLFKWKGTRTMHPKSGSFTCGPYSNGATKTFLAESMWVVECGVSVQRHTSLHDFIHTYHNQMLQTESGEQMPALSRLPKLGRNTKAKHKGASAESLTSGSEGGQDNADQLDNIRDAINRLTSLVATNAGIKSLPTKTFVQSELKKLHEKSDAAGKSVNTAMTPLKAHITAEVDPIKNSLADALSKLATLQAKVNAMPKERKEREAKLNEPEVEEEEEEEEELSGGGYRSSPKKSHGTQKQSRSNENDMYKEMLALAARRKVEDAFHDAQMESERQAGRKRARMLEQYQDDLQAELDASKRKASLEAFRAQQARDDIFSLLQTHGK